MMLLAPYSHSTRHSVLAFRLAPPSFLGESNRKWCTIVSGRTTAFVVQSQQRSRLFLLSRPSLNQNETTATATPFLSNQELVQRRLEARRAQKVARERSVQERAARNWQVKRLLHTAVAAEADLQTTTTTTNSSLQPFLYALKVSVCEDLRRELKLSGREKRGRVFVSSENLEALQSLAGLRTELLAFFRALRKGTFTLSAGYYFSDDTSMNTSLENGNTTTTTTITTTTTPQWWPVETDEDVQATFRRALEHFEQQQQQSRQRQIIDPNNPSVLKRPTILLHVQRDPKAPPPPPPPAYLENMSDPTGSPTMTMLSFYAFPPGGIPDPEDFATQLRKAWKPFRALGRVYVAHEGVNAQMSVPTTVLPNFMDCCRSMEYLGTYMENGINIDPIPLSQEEFQRAGLPQAKDGTPTPPFTNLHVRVRQQVVADGWLGDPTKQFDWQSAGYDMPPLEWHEKLKQARDLQQQKLSDQNANDVPLILDCRNAYETQVGRFEGAEPLNTENFRDSWDVLAERLANVPKDAPIMTYCTGGIRCVKVGAYLTQELGFTNVSRLAGGIIAYDRALQLDAPENEESMFKGTNFVFDGRLGRPITEDALAVCHTCGSETSMVSNCRNDNCHKRMTQCEDCRTSFHGTCSDACRNRLINGAMQPLRTSMTTRANAGEMQQSFSTLSAYSVGHSSPSPSVYKEIELNTKTLIPSGSHMVSGESQGRLLTLLASMTREGRVLELGTFTGYATACLLEGVATAAEITGTKNGDRQSGPYVLTMERDTKAYEVAVAHLKIVAEHGFGEEAAEQLCALRARPTTADLMDETISLQYKDGLVSCDLVLVSDALALVEEMAAGRGNILPAPFDMVFVDADKTRLLEYVDACLSSDLLLKKGGLIIVDNVLWKGLVLEASGAGGQFQEEIDSEASLEEREELRKNRRARRLANKMHRFNQGIVQDHRAEVLVLPIRDGLSLIRKK